MQTITVNGQPLTVKTVDLDQWNNQATITTATDVPAFKHGERVTIETDTHTFKARLLHTHEYANYGHHAGTAYTFRTAYLKDL